MPKAHQRVGRRTLEFRCDDIFELTSELNNVDIVIFMTEITGMKRRHSINMMSHLPARSRVLTYQSFPELLDMKEAKHKSGGWCISDLIPWYKLGSIYSENVMTYSLLPFRQLEINKRLTDRFSSTWTVNRGHHMYIYERTDSLVNSPYRQQLQEPVYPTMLYNDNDDNRTDCESKLHPFFS